MKRAQFISKKQYLTSPLFPFVKDENGATLVEILLSSFIVILLIGSIFGFLGSQQRFFQRQYLAQQRDQQLRFAINTMSHELSESGYLAVGKQLMAHLPEWVPNKFLPTVPAPVRLDSNPKITLSSGNSPDIITFLSVLPAESATVRLSAPSSETVMILDSSESEIEDQFKPGDLICIGDEDTYAAVIKTDGKALIIDADPLTPGAQALEKTYPSGTIVREISVVSYTVFNEVNDPQNKYHPVGLPELKRKVNAGGFQPVAENIRDMRVSFQGGNRISVTLTGVMDTLVTGKGPQEGEGPKQVTGIVHLHNPDEIGLGISGCRYPSVPVNFKVLSALNTDSPCRILMSWDPVSTDCDGKFYEGVNCGVKGYRIYYDVVPKRREHHVDVPFGTEAGAKLDVHKLPSGLYYVSIAAISHGGIGDKTPEIKVVDMVAPSSPVGLNLSLELEKAVYLTWDIPTDCDVSGYRVFRKKGISPEFILISVGPVTGVPPSFSDTISDPGETITYALRFQDHGKNIGPFSKPVSITIPADNP